MVAAEVAPRTLDAPVGAGSAHDLHLTYSRVEVTGNRIRWRVRLFRDDLEATLQTFARRPALSAAIPAGDSAFANYFNARVRISALGTRLTGAVVESGRDVESSDAEMWWYVIEFRAPTPIRSLSINVALLFDRFADQRNLVNLSKEPGGARRSLYFSVSDKGERTLVF